MDNLEPEVIEKDAPSVDTPETPPIDKADAPKVEAKPVDEAKKEDAKPADVDGDKPEGAPKPDWPDDWREKLAGDDEAFLRQLKRYSSPQTFAKGFREREDLIRSGKLKRDMPDAADEKALAEWRKEQGIPDDPTGYQLPEAVQKRMTDDDKPVLANFTEFAHKKNAPPEFVNMAAEWYVESLEQMETARMEQDKAAAEAAEDALRKDWAAGEYRPNMTIAKRFAEEIPGTGGKWLEARLPDGRRLGDVPEVVMWAADMGRDRFGDVSFSNADAERKTTARKDEIRQIMNTDIDRYYSEKLDVEYAQILEREAKRKK